MGAPRRRRPVEDRNIIGSLNFLNEAYIDKSEWRETIIVKKPVGL